MTSLAPHPILSRRSSGVLLHLTSLPGRYGSGSLGDEARHFLDWLVTARQSLWQILPVTPPGAGDSPYQSVSAFAGSPWLVDLDDLARCGWLEWDDLPWFPRDHADFARVLPWRMANLRRAWSGFQVRGADADRRALAAFAGEHADWLDDYCLFMTLESLHGGPWTAWPTAYARRDPLALARLRQSHAAEIGFWQFVQWRFHAQWQRLRQQAHGRGIRLIGDLPIFVAHHSADVWAHTDLFQLDAAGEPLVVAGVPPDYFSETGQRWGNPLYRWDVMAGNGYRWWKRRLAHLLSLVDLVRVDHFRGFEAYWEIAASEPTAVAGQWRPGPGMAFFESLAQTFGSLPIIAEDLGIITDAVRDLRRRCGFPGMRIMQFAFGDDARNPYLPHNFEPATVAYTGTHDNNTSCGWWDQAGETERHAALDYLGPMAGAEIHWAMIQSLSQSVANTLIVPFQDVLGLDGSHRMNTPSQPTGCWAWRFDWSQVDGTPANRLGALTRAHGRG